MSHPVDQIVRPTIPLQTAQSTIVPHIPTIPAGNPVITQTPIGTPITPRPNLPFGFRELNASATTTAQATAQITTGSSIPIQQPGGTALGGPNPIDNIGQLFTTGPQIPGTPASNWGAPSRRRANPIRRAPSCWGATSNRSPPSTAWTNCVHGTQPVENSFSRQSTCLHRTDCACHI
jgi:hypothetical protein